MATRSTRRRSPIRASGRPSSDCARTEALPGRPTLLRGDLSRGGPAGPRRGRADLRRPRLAPISPAARREHPAEVLSRDRAERHTRANGRDCARRLANDGVACDGSPRDPHPWSASRSPTSRPTPTSRAEAVYLDDLPPFRNELSGRVRRQPARPRADRRRSTSPRRRRSRGSRACSPPPTCPATTCSVRSFTTRSSWPRTNAITSASRSSCWPARAARPSARPGQRSGSRWSAARRAVDRRRRSRAGIHRPDPADRAGGRPAALWRGPNT